ncbi:unnamed protein product [Hydatigera taeniaeformis]|uniref:SUN domain-containing protein n=1 Tax=Hydatigena taeniaeformis TaxID=6205 RepID=A0A0R3WHR1_HYDTA|nr:unnamed protein product [Hydatigera taeniaeformis]
MGDIHERSDSSTASLVIPHSLTWFKSSPAACSPWSEDEGCDVAFISYEFLCIYRVCYGTSESGDGYFFTFLDHFKAHDQNVHSVSFPVQFSGPPLEKCFITCGNDRCIRIWSASSTTYALDKGIQLGQDTIPNTCAACSVAGSLYILSASLTGHVIIWEPLSPHLGLKPLVKKFKKDIASSCVWMLSATDTTKLVAIVGYESGDICGYSYDPTDPANKNPLCVLFRKSAHRFDICSLIVASGPEDDRQCFASAGRDADVRLWFLDDYQCKYSYHFRTYQKSSSNPQEPVTSQGKAWISLAPTRISSHNAPQFLAFDPKGNLHTFSCIEKPLQCDSVSLPRHNGLVFSFLAIPNSPSLFISFGMDSQIIVWKNNHNDWLNLTAVANHVCLSSKINSLSQGPGFCSPLAVGLSDGNLLILGNVQPPTPNSFTSMTRLSPLPPSGAVVGISALAWHPEAQYEYLLAIGSSKGHVDIVDVRKHQRRGRNFNQLEGCVYRVVWGPSLFGFAKTNEEENEDTEEEERLLVYAVANGSVFLLLSLKKPLVDLGPKFTPLLVDSSDRKLADIAFLHLAEQKDVKFSWLIGLGSVNGAVNIFGLLRNNGMIVSLSRVDIHKKCINSMVWSHHSSQYLLAVGSSESYITIIDATEQAENKDPGPQCAQFTSCFAVLQGHGTRISSLEWSPCDVDLLLSGSYDCTATVWRVGLGTSAAIANYRNHLSRVFACAWSPHDSDFVFTGEEYGYLVGWRPSAQRVTAPPSYRKHRNPCNKIPACPQVIVQEEVEKDTQPEPDLAAPASQKRLEPFVGKKPSLLPDLFATSSVTDCSVPKLEHSPPIIIQSRFSVVLDFVSYLEDPSLFPEDRVLPEFDLLRSGGALSRRRLVRFTETEALKHLSAASSGPNRQSRLDAYFSLLLWLGRAEYVAKKCVEVQHMPFWLMWALEMMLKGSAPRTGVGCLVESGTPQMNNAPDDFLKHKIIQLSVSNEYTWASTLLVCAGQTAEAVRLLLQCGRAKEALLLLRLRLNPEANLDLQTKCLNLLAGRLAYNGLPYSALAFLAAGQTDRAVAAVRSSAAASDPPLDHIVALWTASTILPNNLPMIFKLAYYCITYAANLSIEEECGRFLAQWKAALPTQKEMNYLMDCASFLLLSEWTGTVALPEIDLVQIVGDRQPSLKQAECIASVVVEFAAACLTEDVVSLKKSLGTLSDAHPTVYANLMERLSIKRTNSSIPLQMSENETVVIEEHTSSGQTLKPIFIYSREEYFDTPLPSQNISTLHNTVLKRSENWLYFGFVFRSHQVSTLSVPRESPNIIAMPKNLPCKSVSWRLCATSLVPQASKMSIPFHFPREFSAYVMAGEYAVPNAQLVRRRIDYQETAEYRIVRPLTGSTSVVDARGDVSIGLRKPLTVGMEECSKTASDEKLSTESSLSSSTRRRTRVSVVEPTDRVLRSQNRRGSSILHRSMNYAIEKESKAPPIVDLEEGEEEEEERGGVTSVALDSQNRQTTFRRRTAKSEMEGRHPSLDIKVTPLDGGRAPSLVQSPRPQYGGGVNALTNRPWHLSSMLGLSAEPSYRSPSLHAEEEQRRRPTTTDTTSSSHRTSYPTSSLRHRLYSCLLNLIAIPLVLLHYLSVVVTTAGKTTASVLSSLYHRVINGRGSSSSSTHHTRTCRRISSDELGLTYAPNYSKGSGRRGHRSQDSNSSLCCGTTPSYCCPLFLLLLLLATLTGFLFRPAEVNPASDETPFFFGLLPSDAQCIRLAFANAHSYIDDAEAGMFHAPHNIRWNCLLWSLWEPSVATLKQQSSVWWNWVQSLFVFNSSGFTSSQLEQVLAFVFCHLEHHQPITSLEGIDNLLKRLQVIDTGMTDLNRQVAELKQANRDRLDAYTKEYGVISTDVNRLEAAIASLKQQITLIADKVTDEDGYEQRRQQILDDLIKQAAFVSTASLDARLQELRKQLEAVISGGATDSTVQGGDQQTERITRFEKALRELGALVMTQKSEMETKLKSLRQEFEAYKEEKTASLEALNAKISGDIVSTAAESRSNLFSLEQRLVADVEKISARVGSVERLIHELEQALQKLISELASLREAETSQQSVSKVRLGEVIDEMKNTFSEQIALDLKKKIIGELAQTTESGPLTQTKLIDLIRSTVDERLRETFANAPQSTTENIPAGVLAYIDSIFEAFMADGTGKADFALESAGGTVVSTRCTRTYTSFKSAVSLFGITLAYWSRSPNEILQPSNHPGECWCFHGSTGQAIVRLAVPVHVTGVSLEHIPKALAHTGRIDSAPREFLIKALESDSAEDGEILGSFIYNEDGKPIQYFPVMARSDGKPTLFVELVITSNHGHPEYTCVYRLRVHGHMATEADAE